VALLLGAWWQELRQGTTALPGIFARLMQGSGYLCFLVLSLAMVVVMGQFFGYDPLGIIRPLLHPKDQSNLPIFTGVISTRPLAFFLWCGVVGSSAFILVWALRRQQWGWVFVTLVAFTMSTFLLVNNVFQPAVAAARTFRPFMARVSGHIGDAPLFFYRTFDSGALYYANRRIPFYDSSLRQSESPCFLLMWEEEWAKIASQDGSGLRATDVSEGTGPKGNHRLVLVYVPAGVVVPGEPDTSADEDSSDVDTL
jgi:hypothetical protein